MKPSQPNVTRSNLPWIVASAVVCLGVVLWTFWPTLEEAAWCWADKPEYSHGYLVPIFAVFLLWLRRGQLKPAALAPNRWGILLVLAGCVLHLAGTYFIREWVEAVALLPCLAGVCLALGGWAAWRWAWATVLFLFFMIPLPHNVSMALAQPLQSLATVGSCFTLQTLGLAAVPQGNVILLNDAKINIVEACSGLRMLVVFFALSTAVALVIRRPLGDRLLIVASAVPIALLVNLVRITATGVLYAFDCSELAHAFVHDLAGWLMMPLALALLWVELKILSSLVVDVVAAGPVRVGLAQGGSVPVRIRGNWKNKVRPGAGRA